MINTLILVIILSLLSYLLLNSCRMEMFMKHNCPPYTAMLNPANSYASFSKGWCTTADLSGMSEDDLISNDNDQSNMKCMDGTARLSVSNSYLTDSKAKCRR